MWGDTRWGMRESLSPCPGQVGPGQWQVITLLWKVSVWNQGGCLLYTCSQALACFT